MFVLSGVDAKNKEFNGIMIGHKFIKIIIVH